MTNSINTRRVNIAKASGELNDLAEVIKADTYFDYLRRLKSNFVGGTGNHYKPSIMFIGEAPGSMENATGKPFQGSAGKIFLETFRLTGLKINDMYVTNVMKYMPIDTQTGKFRKPNNDEIEHVRDYVFEEIGIVQPDVICLLGSVALRTVFPEEASVGKVRGDFMYETRLGNMCLVTYHPSFFQYKGNEKYRSTIEDDFRKLADYVRSQNSETTN